RRALARDAARRPLRAPEGGRGHGAGALHGGLMPLARDVGVLVRWPLYHGFRAFGWPALRPLTMSFVLTDRCNSRCATCSIGARYLDDPSVADGELSLAEYERLFASIGPLEWVTLSGGEPFMRKDLADVALALVRHTRP